MVVLLMRLDIEETSGSLCMAVDRLSFALWNNSQYFRMLFHTVLLKLITPVVIATSQTVQFSEVLQLLSSGVPCSLPCSIWLKQLLKYQLGVWVAPTTNFTAVSYPSSSTNYSREDYLVWNKPLITLARVLWQDISPTL